MPEQEVIRYSSLQAVLSAIQAQTQLTKQAEEDAKAAAAALGGNIFVVSEDEISVRISSVEPTSNFEALTVESGGISLPIIRITV